MELYQLRTFVIVAEEGNFTRASKRVHATQPAVSAHIKALEEEMGVQLFHRTPRGVELTDAGNELMDDALNVLEAAEKMFAHSVTLQGQISGKLALGLCTDPPYLRVTHLLGSMNEQFPKLNLQLTQAPSRVVLSKIHEKELDAGFVFSGIPYSDLEAIKLAEPAYYVIGAAHWKERLQNPTSSELSEFTWLMPTNNCPFRELQLKIFHEHAITPAQTIGADAEEIFRPLVMEGKALGLFREDEVKTLVDAGHCVVCESLGRHPVELNFVYRKSQAKDPAIAALVEVVSNMWDASSPR